MMAGLSGGAAGNAATAFYARECDQLAMIDHHSPGEQGSESPRSRRARHPRVVRLGYKHPGMPRFPPPAEWRNKLLAGVDLSSADLDRLIVECPDEGIHHEFKSGLELSSAKKAGATLRQYVAGFANSDGGFLVVGVTDPVPRLIEGTATPGGGKLNEWATRMLIPIAPYLSPQPKIHTIHYTGAALAPSVVAPVDLLVVAVGRAPAFVPCVEDGRSVFYLRIGDATIAPPEYLITDLLLGRRSRPVLTSLDPRVRFAQRAVVERQSTGVHRATISWAVENESFTLARQLRAGIVSWVAGGPKAASAAAAPRFMHNWIEARNPPARLPYDGEWDPQWRLAHVSAIEDDDADTSEEATKLHPFGRHRVSVAIHLPVAPDLSGSSSIVIPDGVPLDLQPWYRGARKGAVRASVALYVHAENGEPWWSELQFEYTMAAVTAPGTGMFVKTIPSLLEASVSGPPLVSWDFVPQPE